MRILVLFLLAATTLHPGTQSINSHVKYEKELSLNGAIAHLLRAIIITN